MSGRALFGHGARRPAVAAVVVGLLLAGCTAGAGDTSVRATESAGISPSQAAALADGAVTFDEYQAGFRRYQSCMKNLGFDLVSISLAHKVYAYSMTDEAHSSQKAMACYNYEFMQLDAKWQVANQDDSETADHLAECLKSRGMKIPPTVEERLAELQAAGIDPTSCQG